MKKPVFKPEFYRELARDNPLGLTIHWRVVEAWFNYIAWPAYKTYRYTRHQVAVRRWWARVSERDLDRTHNAMENVKMAAAQESQDELPALTDEPGGSNVVSINKILGGKSD